MFFLYKRYWYFHSWGERLLHTGQCFSSLATKHHESLGISGSIFACHQYPTHKGTLPLPKSHWTSVEQRRLCIMVFNLLNSALGTSSLLYLCFNRYVALYTNETAKLTCAGISYPILLWLHGTVPQSNEGRSLCCDRSLRRQGDARTL